MRKENSSLQNQNSPFSPPVKSHPGGVSVFVFRGLATWMHSGGILRIYWFGPATAH